MASTTYTVTAYDITGGEQVIETTDADSKDNARAQYEARGLVVIDVTEAKTKGMGLTLIKARIKPVDVAVFTRQFATMINAGMPMLRALTVLTRQTANPSLKAVLQTLTGDVEAGAGLSEAMAEHPTVFPPLMIAMVKAGEVGGYLDEALKETALSLEKDVKLRAKIKSAATYPVVVMCMGIVGTIAMLIWVVPTFTGMFTSMGGTLPLPTRIVVAMSKAVKVGAIPAVAVGIAFSVWWRKNKHLEAIRSLLDPIKLRLPVFGPLNLKIALARFTRNLSVMLRSGVSIISALDTVAETSGNTVVRNAILATSEHIRAGEQMSAHLGDGDVIPNMVVEMVAVGEDTGALPEMLSKVADFYEEEVSTTTDQLASLLEPILIVSMGLVLGSLVVSMYLPTFKIFDLVK